VDVRDTCDAGKVSDFGFAIARKQHDLSHMVPWPQMADEPRAIFPGLVAKTEEGSEHAIDQQHALESSGRRQPRRFFGTESYTAGDRQVTIADAASQPLPGLLMHLIWFLLSSRSSSSAAFPNPFRCRLLGHRLSLASGTMQQSDYWQRRRFPFRLRL